MRTGETGSLRLVFTLAAAGLLSGLVLVSVYLQTKPRIDRNRIEAMNAAILRVLPGTARTASFVLRDDRLSRLDDPTALVLPGRGVFAGFSEDGELLGYAIPAEGPGYADTIRLIYGFDPTRRVVVGMQVLESRETPGLGDKIGDDPEFHRSFRALSLEPAAIPVKSGSRSGPNEVDCITGATISSEAVVSIINRSSRQWLPLLEGAGVEQDEVADALRTGP